MKKLRKFLCIPLILVLFLSSTLVSYARTEWTFEEKLRYMEDNFSSFLANTVGFVIGEGDADVIYHSLMSIFEQKVMESNDVTYQDWLLNHLGFDFDDNNNVLGVEVDPVVINLMNDGVNQYVQEHPMSYSYQWIFGSDSLMSTSFATSQQYNSFISAINDCPSNYVISPVWNYRSTNSTLYYKDNNGSSTSTIVSNANNRARCFIYPVKADGSIYDFDIYNTTGHLNNYSYAKTLQLSSDWVPLNYSTLEGSNFRTYWRGKVVLTDGSVYDIDYLSTRMIALTLCNSNYNFNLPSESSQGMLLLSQPNKEVHFVYDSIDALKIHDTGQPAPYYYSSNYKGSDYVASDSALLNTGTIENSGNNYQDITNNITNGMTAEEVIQLVDTIMKNNNDKPWSPPSDDGGGGGSDSDGIWGSIGSAIGKLFGAIGDFILGLINGLLDKVEELIDSIKGIFDKLTDLVPNVIGDLFSSLFSWLPEEFVTLITASLGLIVIFGIIRMIRG